MSVDFDASGRRLVLLEANAGGVYSVDPSTGEHRLISGSDFAGTIRGGGPLLGFMRERYSRPESVEVDPIDPVAYVAGGASFGLFAVDMISGDRVIVSH